jgi:hypothetical protein
MVLADPYSLLIHRALVQRVHDSEFPQLTFPNGAMVLGDGISPATVQAGQIESVWDRPQRNRLTGYLRERREWPWDLIVRFDRHVSFEQFEATLEEDPPEVARDATHPRQVTLLVVSARYVEPPHNQPAGPCEAIYRFIAVMTPV